MALQLTVIKREEIFCLEYIYIQREPKVSTHLGDTEFDRIFSRNLLQYLEAVENFRCFLSQFPLFEIRLCRPFELNACDARLLFIVRQARFTITKNGNDIKMAAGVFPRSRNRHRDKALSTRSDRS